MASKNPVGTTQEALMTDTGIAMGDDSEDRLDLLLLNIKRQEGQWLASEKTIDDAKVVLLKREFKRREQEIKDHYKDEAVQAAKLAELKQELNEKTIELARKMELNRYRFSSKEEKRQIRERQKMVLDETKSELQKKMAIIAAEDTHSLHRVAEMKKYGEVVSKIYDEQISLEQQKRKLTIGILQDKRRDSIITLNDLEKQHELISQSYEEERRIREEKMSSIDAEIEYLKNLKKNKNAGTKETEQDKEAAAKNGGPLSKGKSSNGSPEENKGAPKGTQGNGEDQSGDKSSPKESNNGGFDLSGVLKGFFASTDNDENGQQPTGGSQDSPLADISNGGVLPVNVVNGLPSTSATGGSDSTLQKLDTLIEATREDKAEQATQDKGKKEPPKKDTKKDKGKSKEDNKDDKESPKEPPKDPEQKDALEGGPASQSESGGLTEDQIEKLIASLEKQKEEEAAALKEADKERFKGELLANTMKAGLMGMQNSLKALSDKFSAAVDNAIDTVGQYKSILDARLQGTSSSYDDVANTLKRSLAVSPFVKQTEVLKKLNDAVSKGIAYNAEQRAFLATMTDKIVATFDAFDATLTRLVRLQQADTTAARMGMEAHLLKFFNRSFSDNSYLEEGYDDVSQALLEANAQLSRDMSISFEFTVQKWLGSLSSLGFSNDTIQTIAQGIGYLGSGNVQALAGNEQLQNLLAMAAARTPNLSYSDMLVNGINDSQINDLLKSMVVYLAEIADDENAVVRAAYGDVFNFTQSDLQAIRNLTVDNMSTINDIYNQSMTYKSAMGEIQSQLFQIGKRLSMSEMINNTFDNFLYTAGESIASDPVTAILWKTLNVVEQVTGGIKIPFVNVFGFGLDLNMSITELMKTGIFGLSVLGNVGKMATSLLSGGGLSLGIWGAQETTPRGRGGDFSPVDGGLQSGVSGSGATTSASSSDQKKQAISSTSEDQEEQKKSSKESMKDEITIETVYKEFFDKKTPVNVVDSGLNSKIKKIQSLLSLAAINKASLSVTVSNMPEFGDLLSGKKSTSITEGSIEALASKISEKLSAKILGTANDNDEVSYTVTDIVEVLTQGVIRVHDSELDTTMKEINRDLLI